MKLPKIRLRRADVERALIACSAVLVLLLSVKSGRDSEPYEEPLEDIPQVSVFASLKRGYLARPSFIMRMRGTAIWFRYSARSPVGEGIAKATLERWCRIRAQRHGMPRGGAYSCRAGRDDV